jgi:hypothetical protein
MEGKLYAPVGRPDNKVMPIISTHDEDVRHLRGALLKFD